MKFEDFCQEIFERMESEYPDCQISLKEIKKNNDLTLTAIIIKQPDSNISPTVYLNGYYDDNLRGKDMNTIVAEIKQVNDEFQARGNQNNHSISSFTEMMTSKEKFLENVCFKVISTEMNKDYLKDKPHVDTGDLSFVFFIPAEMNVDGFSSSIVLNNQIEALDISIDELTSYATLNTQTKFPAEIMSMYDVLVNKLGMPMEFLPPAEEPPMYVLGNTRGINGASALFYQDAISQLTDTVGGDAVILPSSIHEVIVLPASASHDFNFLREMVGTVNVTEVAKDEVLSNNCYFADAKTKELFMVKEDNTLVPMKNPFEQQKMDFKIDISSCSKTKSQSKSKSQAKNKEKENNSKSDR